MANPVLTKTSVSANGRLITLSASATDAGAYDVIFVRFGHPPWSIADCTPDTGQIIWEGNSTSAHALDAYDCYQQMHQAIMVRRFANNTSAYTYLTAPYSWVTMNQIEDYYFVPAGEDLVSYGFPFLPQWVWWGDMHMFRPVSGSPGQYEFNWEPVPYYYNENDEEVPVVIVDYNVGLRSRAAFPLDTSWNLTMDTRASGPDSELQITMMLDEDSYTMDSLYLRGGAHRISHTLLNISASEWGISEAKPSTHSFATSADYTVNSWASFKYSYDSNGSSQWGILNCYHKRIGTDADWVKAYDCPIPKTAGSIYITFWSWWTDRPDSSIRNMVCDVPLSDVNFNCGAQFPYPTSHPASNYIGKYMMPDTGSWYGFVTDSSTVVNNGYLSGTRTFGPIKRGRWIPSTWNAYRYDNDQGNTTTVYESGQTAISLPRFGEATGAVQGTGDLYIVLSGSRTTSANTNLRIGGVNVRMLDTNTLSFDLQGEVSGAPIVSPISFDIQGEVSGAPALDDPLITISADTVFSVGDPPPEGAISILANTTFSVVGGAAPTYKKSGHLAGNMNIRLNGGVN